MATLVGHGPQWRVGHVRFLSAGLAFPRPPVGLLPGFEDVIDQVLWENRMHNKRRRKEASSSLRKCLSQRTKLRDKLDTVNKALEVTSAGPAHLKMEERLHAIHASLSVVEKSVTKFENLIEESRMLEDEAHQMEEEETSQDQPSPPWRGDH